MSNSSSPPRVTVCLPNLNTRPFLEERIASIQNQTLSDWELVIFDNESTDGASEYLRQFADGEPRARFFSAPKAGMYANWNNCLRTARGEYVYIATSDDTMHPRCLQELVSALHSNPGCQVAVCDHERIDTNGAVLPKKGVYRQHLARFLKTEGVRDGKLEFLLCCYFGTIWVTITSVLFRRELLETVGLFPTDVGSHGDVEWTLRACLQSNVAWVPEKLATWRIHTGQATPARFSWKDYNLVLKAMSRAIKDSENAMPPHWKSVPLWKEKLLYTHRESAREALGIYRWDALKNPHKFLTSIAQAATWDPAFLLRKILCGFGPGKEMQPFDTYPLRSYLQEFGMGAEV